jgi:hypothetical protein
MSNSWSFSWAFTPSTSITTHLLRSLFKAHLTPKHRSTSGKRDSAMLTKFLTASIWSLLRLPLSWSMLTWECTISLRNWFKEESSKNSIRKM